MWRKSRPESVHNLRGFEETLPEIKKNIVDIAKDVGSEDVEESGVVELLESFREAPSAEELMELQQAGE